MRNAPKPCRFPEDAALGLAAIMPGAIAANVAENDTVAQPPATAVVHGVADLVRAPPNGEAATTKRDHLGHEGKTLVPSLGIERGQNLGRTSYLDKVSSV